MNFDTANILMPLRLTDIFVAAFPRKIIFGVANNNFFKTKQSFCIDLEFLKLFYIAIVQILSNFQSESLEKINCIEIYQYEGLSYYWQMHNTENVKFVLKEGETIVYKLLFNYLQFNELIFVISECILPCLSLKSIELMFLESATKLDVLQLIELNDLQNVQSYVEKLKEPFCKEHFKYKILLHYNLDIIITINRIKFLANDQILPNNLKSVLQKI